MVGSCAFVQTGVIGLCNRDGFRHSRLLRLDGQGYRLFTCDHDTGGLRLDLAHGWADVAAPAPIIAEDEVICDPAAGWLCSQLTCRVGESSEYVRWIPAGADAILAVQNDMVVEYDLRSAAPVGLVALLKGAEARDRARAPGRPTARPPALDRPAGPPARRPRGCACAAQPCRRPRRWRRPAWLAAARRRPPTPRARLLAVLPACPTLNRPLLSRPARR